MKAQEETDSTDSKEEQQSEELVRRDFLVRAAALAFSATTLGVFLEACTKAPDPTAAPFPTSTPLPTATPSPTPLPAPTFTPTATPSPTPTATATPRPTATPTPTSTPSPTPTATPFAGADLASEKVRITHLLRRAGFGASPIELLRFFDMGWKDTVDYLIEYDKVNDSALETRLASLPLDKQKLNDLQRWWFLRMIYTKRPLQEKMVLFWHGLLTSAYNKVGQGLYMYNQNQLFRDQALGSYDTLLKAISRDPAMLVWLDSRSNRKTAPNENFARELMELFSMGVGHYTETDVRESARAFTGWGLRNDGFAFVQSEHDTGIKTFLGQTGNFDGDNIVDIILQQPAAAEFISRRLFAYFAYDNPEPAVVARLSKTFRDSKFSIKALVRDILMSPEFVSWKAYRAKVKSPTELAASAVRSLEMETDASFLPGVTTRMGQNLFNPPDVSGWPEGATWINSNTLLQRLNFNYTVTAARRGSTSLDINKILPKEAAASCMKSVEPFVALLLDGYMPPQEKDVLNSFAKSLDQASGGKADAIERGQRDVLYLALSSPDYQLA